MLGTAVAQRHARHAEVGQERGDEISGGEGECWGAAEPTLHYLGAHRASVREVRGSRSD